MASAKTFRIVGIVVLIACIVGVLVRGTHRDSRIDPFVDYRGGTIPLEDAAIEPEVINAEAKQYGSELIPALRAELHRRTWRSSKLYRQLLKILPQEIREANAHVLQDLRERREQAAITLGRLGPKARSAIPDLATMAASSDPEDALDAEIALTLIQRDNPAVRGNAMAALTSRNQPRRIQFITIAHDLWPNRPELLYSDFHDRDATTRARAVSVLRLYGPSASNAAPVLVQMLSDPSPEVRPRAALALGFVAPAYAKKAAAVMLNQQRTNMAWTGDFAYVLYQHVGPAARAAVPYLQAQLANPKMMIFHGDVAAALWRITGKVTPQIVDALSTGISNTVQREEIRSLRALKEIGPPAAAAAPALRSLTNHPRLLIRRLAREALESVSRPTANASKAGRGE